MDLLDRLLDHDAWTTRRMLASAARLTDEELDREFDLGLRTVRATFQHIVRNMEIWTDLMAGGAIRPDGGNDPAGRTVAALTARLDVAATNLARVARDVADRNAWDELWLDHLDDPPRWKSYGGAIVHVITHSLHHRAQLSHLLRRLGASDVPEGDVLGWEAAISPLQPRSQESRS